MVLPASIVDDPAGSHPWLSRIDRILHLGRAGGVMVLITNAIPARLHALVAALGQSATASSSALHVCLRAYELLEVADGSVVLLRGDGQDAAWLNEYRPLIALRRWRVVLWTDEAAALALKREAPDFWDWISHVIPCPPGIAGFAVRGIEQAPRFPGIAWHGEDLDAVLAATGAEHTRVSMDEHRGASGHGRLVSEAMQAPGWLVMTGVPGVREVTRVRWALAESGRPGRVVLENPQCECPGWWPAGDMCMDWQAAREELAGVAQGARLAALLGLEPGAIELAAELARRDSAAVDRAELLVRLADARDPGAELAREAHARGLVDRARVACWDAGAPVLRALFDVPEVVEVRAEVVAQALALAQPAEPPRGGEGGDSGTLPRAPGELIAWANTQPVLAPELLPASRDYRVAAYLGEAGIRYAAHRPEASWFSLAQQALAIGHHEVVACWVGTHEMGEGNRGLVRFQLGQDGRIVEELHEPLAAKLEAPSSTVHAEDVPSFAILGMALTMQGKAAEAIALTRAVLERVGDHPWPKAVARRTLSRALIAQHRYEEAREVLLTTLHDAEDEGDDGLRATVLHDLGFLASRQHRYQDAESLYRQALACHERLPGPEHPDTSHTLVTLAEVLLAQQQYREAESLLRRALEGFMRSHGEGAAQVAELQGELATALVHQGKLDDAERWTNKALASLTERPDSDALRATLIRKLGMILTKRGEYRQAEDTLRQAMTIGQQTLGAESVDQAITLKHLAFAVLLQDRREEARELARQAGQIIVAQRGPEDPLLRELELIEPLPEPG